VLVSARKKRTNWRARLVSSISLFKSNDLDLMMAGMTVMMMMMTMTMKKMTMMMKKVRSVLS